ncbi:hypothetical protein CBF23_000950 [Marinomonas agarivorans]|nr:hypothetical protein CBF23_000950 [Marinomonas agarivorans]
MNKKAFLKAYQDVNQLASKPQQPPSEDRAAKIYRSAKDEELIKDYHYAKFQKNFHQTQNDPELRALIEKDDWSDEDTKQLLARMR